MNFTAPIPEQPPAHLSFKCSMDDGSHHHVSYGHAYHDPNNQGVFIEAGSAFLEYLVHKNFTIGIVTSYCVHFLAAWQQSKIAAAGHAWPQAVATAGNIVAVI